MESATSGESSINSIKSNSMPNTIEIVISDDHSLVRHGVKGIINSTENFKVIAEAQDADETLQVVKERTPDVLILDLGLPNKSGLEVIYEINELGLNTKIIVLTMYDDDAKVLQAVKAGADGYLVKDCSPNEFTEAIEKVLGGGKYLSEKFRHLESEIGELEKVTDDSLEDPLSKLSKREREVFFLLSEGLPNREIAQKLFISPRTVETHRARVIKKLKCKSTADLIRYAIRHNLMLV